VAIEAQSQGQFREILAVIKRRLWQVVLPAILGLAVANAVSVILPRNYKVTSQIELREVVLPIGGFGGGAQFIRRDINSAPYHVRSLERIRRVIEKLEWQDFTALTTPERYEYLKRVSESIGVDVRGGMKTSGSAFILLRYNDSDPQRAEQFLNRLRDSYTAEVVERFRNTARDARDTLQNQLSIAHQALIVKEKESSELKKQYSLSPTQQAPGGGRERAEDPVFIRQAQAQSELMTVSAQLLSAQTVKKELEDRYNQTPREVPERSLTGGVGYDQLLVQIGADIERYKAAQEGLRPLHSKYQAAELEIEKLVERRRQIEDQLLNQSGDDVRMVINPQREILQQQIQDRDLEITELTSKRNLLEAQIDDLSRRSSELTDVYREVTQLDAEVSNLRDRYNGAVRLYERQKAFVEFIAQPHANPFTVSEVARALTEPSSPDETLVITAGLILGLALGMGMAIFAEYGRTGFRGAADISRILTVPVLGVVNTVVTRREARAMLGRRTMVVSSTLILAGVIFWVTWAYEEQPRLLGPQLTHFIDGMRMELR